MRELGEAPEEAMVKGKRFTGKMIVDLPARTLALLHRFPRQTGGRPSQRARLQDFESLRDDCVAKIEGAYATCVEAIPVEPSLAEQPDSR